MPQAWQWRIACTVPAPTTPANAGLRRATIRGAPHARLATLRPAGRRQSSSSTPLTGTAPPSAISPCRSCSIFAHGHFLIQTGRPLVQGAFEAWNNGPVHPAVYHAFKASGRDPIHVRATGRDIMTGQTRPLAEPQGAEVLGHIERVLKAYGHLSPGLLVAISHAAKGPWATIRDRAARSTTLGARIPDSLTIERFRYQKIAIASVRGIGQPGGRCAAVGGGVAESAVIAVCSALDTQPGVATSDAVFTFVRDRPRQGDECATRAGSRSRDAQLQRWFRGMVL